MNIHAARLTTKVLAIACAALILAMIVQLAGFGRGFGWLSGAGFDASSVQLANIDSQPVQLPPASAFSDIEAHPLFNPDRQPTPLDASEAEEEAVAPLSPLNVALTGVILDEKNQVRIAMLQDKASNQSVALKVGMPLAGEQASWTLIEVKPRLVVFRNAADETAEVELETAAAPALPARPAGRTPATRGRGTAPAASAKEAEGSSALAQRIEERRRQMREDAERLRTGKSSPDEKQSEANNPAPPKK